MDHTVVVDLGYGDAGKGSVVDHLCASAEVRAVIRFNGGAQAAHNVVLPDGRHHTFAQFGSGTLRGVPTHLSRFMVVDPLALAGEGAHLAALGVDDPFRTVTVDGAALLATPWHAAANRLRESRRSAKHGSCGMGVGETMAYALAHPADAPRAGDAPALLRRRLALVRERLTDALLPDSPWVEVEPVLEAFLAFRSAVSIVDGVPFLGALLDDGPCVFEGAQGVLLDEWFGWHPHTTWSTTTFDNASRLLAEAGHTGYRLGVVRTYTTRHGNGPMVTEDPALAMPEPHNGNGRWQGAFRLGHFDAVAHRYAVEVAGGVDGVAVTHLDTAAAHPDLRICDSYDLDGVATRRLVPGRRGDLAYTERMGNRLANARPVLGARPADWSSAIGEALGAPVVLESWGPSSVDKRRVGRMAPSAPADRSRAEACVVA